MKKKFLISFTLFLLIFIIAILQIQEDAFFYPWHDAQSYAELLKIQDFEEIKIDNAGNTCLSFLQSDIYKYFDGYNFMIVDYPN